ncbi:nitrate- and nitrite sensing domain-containing protein [Halopseudomonas salegens]|uniref:Nitrate and nitrite sensing n=1 Tax=Halopseudomonas salegens TaxID=1434072 RepID=A0A1H2F117_9GAMM|nr:nitrate- and nitrite sensing domain-containing protein [Halopseudomonas salegens]SDU00999.1 Nitrate and nitrite sensing [Halopseudomonas salegens]
MSPLLLPVLVVVLLLAILWHYSRVRRQRGIWRERERALEQILLLRELLEQMQRHRGLMFGVMSGEQSLANQRWTIYQQVGQLLKRALAHESSLFWYASWHHMQSLWEDIDVEHEHATAEQVLTWHNRLIVHLLDTITAIAERHDLVRFGQLAANGDGHWFELLQNTELLGRARAIGTGIAARRQNTAMQREELLRLGRRISDEAYLVLARLHAEPELRLSVASAVREAEESLDRLVALIETLLQADHHLKSSSYFTIATQAISAQYALADILLERLAREYGLLKTPSAGRDSANA